MSIFPPDASSYESRRSNACAALAADDFARVVEAAELYVSSRSALMSFISILGNLVHQGLRRLPDEWRDDIIRKIRETLKLALKVSIARIDDQPGRKSSGGRYTAIAMATGAGGGAFGLPSVLAELPITTGLILRSIADIGRSCGERLDDPEFRATCIEVFAYGTPLDEEDEEIAFVLARMGAIESASKISEAVARIAVRYAATLAPKIAAMSVPATGAVLGARELGLHELLSGNGRSSFHAFADPAKARSSAGAVLLRFSGPGVAERAGRTSARGQTVKGLIVHEPWIDLIVSGAKTWEMRSRNTAVRGRIALIRKGSKAVFGVADLVDTVPKLSQSDLKASVDKHQVLESEIDEDFKWSTAWVLERARPLRRPVPYHHPAGAVIWVNLDSAVAAMVEQQLADG
jgi:hypothetical protein